MQIKFVVIGLLFLACTSTAFIDFTTCARMDWWLLGKMARGLCISSCSAQNCGTGNCERRWGRPTCVCSRCARGGNVPFDAMFKRG